MHRHLTAFRKHGEKVSRQLSATYSSRLNSFHFIISLVIIEGFKGFYAGFKSPLYGQMFFRAASFATFRMVMATTNPAGTGQPNSLDLMRAGIVFTFT